MENSSMCENVVVGHMVLQFDAQDMPRATHVGGVKSMFLAYVCGPGLTAI